ncbi:hypothetical protein IAD21_03596 [Abditibacteriota bacterium]|nr:hypothetical protein IAD21_03596 [Abditibacteriota bacterium]
MRLARMPKDEFLAAPLMRWKEPRIASEWEWRHKEWPRWKHIITLFWKAGLIAGLPLFMVLKTCLPISVAPGCFGLFVTCGVLPALLSSQLWMDSKTGTFCSVRVRGLSKQGMVVEWEKILAYQFVDLPQLLGVRCLQITFIHKEQEARHHLYFSPDEVDEEKIEQLIQSHLPTRSP